MESLFKEAESFSGSGFLGENRKFNTMNPMLSAKATKMNIIIDK